MVTISKCRYNKLIDDNYINFPINYIKKEKKTIKVYNFEVADDNSYTVQNLSVHNCHYSFQFHVELKNNIKYLNCIFNMRSTDVFLGLPFNIFSYTVLTYIIALKCDLVPGQLIYSGADVHIYQNHIESVKTQLSRRPHSEPKLTVSQDVKFKDFSEITVDDFEVIGYFPSNTIKAPMAV
jgi:thymidylate synthase